MAVFKIDCQASPASQPIAIARWTWHSSDSRAGTGWHRTRTLFWL